MATAVDGAVSPHVEADPCVEALKEITRAE